jgi:hypothetical protein
MRDMQRKMLERIEMLVASSAASGRPLEFLVNHSRENSGQICIQPVESFVSILECSFVFESKFAVFDFGTVEMQVEYSRPETVTRVLDGFRSAVALYARGMERRPTLVRK